MIHIFRFNLIFPIKNTVMFEDLCRSKPYSDSCNLIKHLYLKTEFLRWNPLCLMYLKTSHFAELSRGKWRSLAANKICRRRYIRLFLTLVNFKGPWLSGTKVCLLFCYGSLHQYHHARTNWSATCICIYSEKHICFADIDFCFIYPNCSNH